MALPPHVMRMAGIPPGGFPHNPFSGGAVYTSNLNVELRKLFEFMDLDIDFDRFVNMTNDERTEYVRDIKLKNILK